MRSKVFLLVPLLAAVALSAASCGGGGEQQSASAERKRAAAFKQTKPLPVLEERTIRRTGGGVARVDDGGDFGSFETDVPADLEAPAARTPANAGKPSGPADRGRDVEQAAEHVEDTWAGEAAADAQSV